MLVKNAVRRTDTLYEQGVAAGERLDRDVFRVALEHHG